MALDHSKIPNMANINKDFLDPIYDPGRKFSMPYTWLVLGLGFRKSKMNGIVARQLEIRLRVRCLQEALHGPGRFRRPDPPGGKIPRL